MVIIIATTRRDGNLSFSPAAEHHQHHEQDVGNLSPLPSAPPGAQCNPLITLPTTLRLYLCEETRALCRLWTLFLLAGRTTSALSLEKRSVVPLQGEREGRDYSDRVWRVPLCRACDGDDDDDISQQQRCLRRRLPVSG